MLRTVELPLWLLILILLFAAVTFASHFLFPSVRWFLRRRAERLVAKLNERLERPIEPFKLARRTDMIQRLIYDPAVVEAVADYAHEKGVREDVAFEVAKRYAREIVPGFSASAYFGFATRAAWLLSRYLFDVSRVEADPEALRRIDRNATVIYVMNHRSNMDYVLVTYLVARRAALSYAVGEWARIWPLGPLIRALGGYFIRRRSGNALYRRVLARYVQMARAGGVTQALFPEGGLSLTGRMGRPKVGLLSYLLDGFDPEERDIVFVPVALNYDRVIEDRILTEANHKGDRRFRWTVPSAMVAVMRYVWRRMTLRARRMGTAAVSFGVPLSLKDEGAGLGAEALAETLMARISAVMPVLPVPLVAAVIEAADGPLLPEALRAAAIRRLDDYRAAGAPIFIDAEAGAEAALDQAVSRLQLRKILRPGADGIEVVRGKERLVTFYAGMLPGNGAD